MCDQLRHDALSCAGGLVDTPNLDALARRGVRFDRAFAQGSVCGSSRMSAYTGRYVQSHGSRYNSVPLSIAEPTIGDHLRPLDVRSVLIGKTHMARDRSGLDRLRLDPHDPWTTIINQCGFEPIEREDGLVPNTAPALFERGYNKFLLDQGYDGPNPWHTVANSVLTPEGDRMSGWLLEASQYPAIVPDELSETAYMTNRAIDFIRDAGDERWCIHLSYIKPHWPYVVSEPYHRLVHRNDLPSPNRSNAELETDHPVIAAFQRSRIGSTFSRDEVRTTVYPAYLGLVKQLDDHLGRLFRALDDLGRRDDTMIVLTSDHGDYMGDHWMGEKDWLHEEVVRIPMIVADPRAGADATRGSVSTDLIEMIDLAPTFVDALDWVVTPNVMGMSQFADLGSFTSKPYAASGKYVDRMSDYCAECVYDVKSVDGPNACPMNSLYWSFIDRHEDRWMSNHRMAMITRGWMKRDPEKKRVILERAADVHRRLASGEL